MAVACQGIKEVLNQGQNAIDWSQSGEELS